MITEEAQRFVRNLPTKDIPLFGSAVSSYITLLDQLKDPADITDNGIGAVPPEAKLNFAPSAPKSPYIIFFRNSGSSVIARLHASHSFRGNSTS